MFLTEEGRALVATIDTSWKRLEREALVGLDEKDRKKLRKLLRQIEKNLGSRTVDEVDTEDGEPGA